MIIEHHRIPRSMGGSWEDINLMKTDARPEQKMHAHHGVRVFHQKLLQTLDWDGPILIPQVRQALITLIDSFGPDMYNPKAIKNWKHIDDSFIHRATGIAVPHHYHD